MLFYTLVVGGLIIGVVVVGSAAVCYVRLRNTLAAAHAVWDRPGQLAEERRTP